MLVLSRFEGESVLCFVPPSEHQQVIQVMLIDSRGDKCRLGFKASPEVIIHREEIIEKIRIADGEENVELEV